MAAGNLPPLERPATWACCAYGSWFAGPRRAMQSFLHCSPRNNA